MSHITNPKTRGKLTKKELKQDKLVQLAYRVEHLYFQYQKWVVSIAVGILVVVVASFLISRATRASRLQDTYQLTMAKLQADAGQTEQARESLSRLISSAGGKVAGEAKFHMGRIAYEHGNYSEAADLFSGYLKEFSVDEDLDCAAMMGLAASYRAMGKLEDAAQTYGEAGKTYPRENCAAQALWEASKLYIVIKQYDRAKEMLLAIRNSYGESSVAGQARRELDALSYRAE